MIWQNHQPILAQGKIALEVVRVGVLQAEPPPEHPGPGKFWQNLLEMEMEIGSQNGPSRGKKEREKGNRGD